MDYMLNKKVKELCRERGMQLRDLAEKMGIAPESLSRAINGNPQLSTLKNIADVLGVPIARLFTPTVEVFKDVKGILIYKDIPYIINGLDDLKMVAAKVEADAVNVIGVGLPRIKK